MLKQKGYLVVLEKVYEEVLNDGTIHGRYRAFHFGEWGLRSVMRLSSFKFQGLRKDVLGKSLRSSKNLPQGAWKPRYRRKLCLFVGL